MNDKNIFAFMLPYVVLPEIEKKCYELLLTFVIHSFLGF